MVTITIAQYLFQRLKQCGVHSIFGVPGDYNLKLLDYIQPSKLQWVGNCNELNAGYAADAYSRINGIGALITTYGVGELSAINAIAGAYAEKAPVIHIVGAPSRASQKNGTFLHHTLGDGQFNHFAKMYELITVAQADLQDPRQCPDLIDSTIRQCLIQKRPVYIVLPEDIVDIQVDSTQLATPLLSSQSVSAEIKDILLAKILARVYSSSRPALLIDGESSVFGLTQQLNKVAELTGWPTFTTPFGKSIIDETLPNFCGLWKRDVSPQDHLDFADQRDLVMCFGPHWSDTNTFGFSSIPEESVRVCFTDTSVSIGPETYQDVPVKFFLKTLSDKLDQSRIPREQELPMFRKQRSLQAQDPKLPITQAAFYTHFSSFFKQGDIILAETGTAGHGARDFDLPSRSILFNPVTWLSIGYMLPAALGASLAKLDARSKDEVQKGKTPRTILFIGDGSFQMSAQELGTILRHKLNFLLVLINNDGYTIERCIHGKDQSYNDVAAWDYLMAPALFGASRVASADYPVRTDSVRTWGELDSFLGGGGEGGLYSPGFSMLEVIMPREDAPKSLLNLLDKQY